MTKFFALALLASVVSAPAMATTFTQDGVTYDYSVEKSADVTLISGTIVNSGKPFRLRVKGEQVSGIVGGSAVSFKTTSVTTASAAGKATVLASN